MKQDRVDIAQLTEQLRGLGMEDPEAMAETLRPLLSTIIAREDRRRRDGMRLAHREGFLAGKIGSRSMPYHSHLWTASDLYRRMFGKKAQDPELAARYARYNDD